MESVSGRAAMDACNELRWTDPHKVQIGDSKRTGVPNRFTKRESKALYVLGYASWDMHLGICKTPARAKQSADVEPSEATRRHALPFPFFLSNDGRNTVRARKKMSDSYPLADLVGNDLESDRQVFENSHTCESVFEALVGPNRFREHRESQRSPKYDKESAASLASEVEDVDRAAPAGLPQIRIFVSCARQCLTTRRVRARQPRQPPATCPPATRHIYMYPGLSFP